MKLRIGLVGLGSHWDSFYRPALHALADRFEVRAICESVSQRAERAARQMNAEAVDGYGELARRSDIDAVLLLSSQWYGPLPILAACEQGKAIYCASALDMASEDIDKVRRQVDESGVAFMVEFPRRLAPATLRLKELIATKLGAPKLLFCHDREPITAPAKHHQNNGCAANNDRQVLELIDWCQYVVGTKATSVSCVAHCSADSQVGDYHALTLDFASDGPCGSGPMAQISSGRYMPAAWHEAISFRPPAALQVSCENGVAFLDLPTTLIWFDEAGRHMESLDGDRPVGETLLWQFHRSVTSLLRSTSSLEEAFDTLKVWGKAQQSFADGRRIGLGDE